LRKQIVLLASALVAIGIFLLIFHARDAILQSSHGESSNIGTRPALMLSTPSATDSSANSSPPRIMGQIDTLRVGFKTPPMLLSENGNRSKLTESADPEARQLFRELFKLMDNGNYREAGLKLRAFLKSKTLDVGKSMDLQNEFMPYAVWLDAWCMLNERESEKTLYAAAQVFSLYANTWQNHDEELAKAAWINRALICMELLSKNSAKQDDYIKSARYSLNEFLEHWPNDTKVTEVRNLLNSLDNYYPRP